MKHLKHSNNLCTVGWTCIYAMLTPDEMRELLVICPQGTFSPTWYQWGKDILTPDQFEAWIEKENAKRKKRGHYSSLMESMGFYFNFPRDEAGETLLAEMFSPEDIEPNQWL